MYTLQGKTRPTRHVCFLFQSTHARRTLSTSSPRTWQPFTSSHEFKIWHTPRRSNDNQRQTGPTVVLGGFILPPMRQPSSREEWFRPNGYTVTSTYYAHITSMRSVCLILAREANPSVLTDTGDAYNLGGVGLPHTHSLTFPTSCLHFPLVAPPDLHFNQVPVIKPKYWVLKNIWPSRGLSTIRSSTIAYIYV
jgi:hypothetical protein